MEIGSEAPGAFALLYKLLAASVRADVKLREAIRSRRLIRLTYHDVDRVVDPHDHGPIAESRETFSGSRMRTGQRHFQWDERFLRVMSRI